MKDHNQREPHLSAADLGMDAKTRAAMHELVGVMLAVVREVLLGPDDPPSEKDYKPS